MQQTSTHPESKLTRVSIRVRIKSDYSGNFPGCIGTLLAVGPGHPYKPSLDHLVRLDGATVPMWWAANELEYLEPKA